MVAADMSARTLTTQTMAKLVKQNRDKEDTDPPDLGPDEMRLYSYYRPGLVAGNYMITATQSVSSPTANWGTQEMRITNEIWQDGAKVSKPQEFEVVVPRFSLDSKIVNSYYPPDGHQDEGRVLPHIVFEDPHYPWEVPAGTLSNMAKPIDPHPVTTLVDGVKQTLKDSKQQPIVANRSLVPWVALLVFDPEELHLDDQDDLSADKGLGAVVKSADLLSQNAKGTFQRTVKEYLSLASTCRINYEADDETFEESKKLTANIDVIFPKKRLFKDIFAYNDPDTGAVDTSLKALEAMKYMTHVRHINTIGFPDVGIEADGLYSIVVSSRLGAYNIDKPHTQVCHLVSIEHVDTTLGPLIKDTTNDDKRIGMVSLFSWVYTALPPNPVNFVHTVRNLVTQQQMLCVNPESLADITSKMTGSDTGNAATKTASSMMIERLKQGYTFSRWRTSSGEQTAAFNRGPLVPGLMTSIPDDVPDSSNTSQDFQIFDSQTGIMDLSYSTAWQLGKSLAISDKTFSAALMRFRSTVYNNSVQRTQMIVNSVVPASTAVQSISSVVSSLQSESEVSSVDPNRVTSGTDKSTSPVLQDPAVRAVLQANNEDLVSINASAGSGDDIEVFNEFNKNKSNNSDWAVVHAWLCEKLCLAGIPPQYLFPESAYLPRESLRYFYIDNFWLDCLIDGALSVANHLDPVDDGIRRAMKRIFNSYLSTPVNGAGYRPQIPCYGFVIRSQLIKAMPDLRITVTWLPLTDTTKPDQRAPVCRWTKFDDETLICLLDRYPEELKSIVLAQPPHQQRFSLGSYVRKGDPNSTDTDLKSDVVEFDLRRLYTSETPNSDKKDYPFGYNPEDEWKEKKLPDTVHPQKWLNFDTRVMCVTKMAKEINTSLLFTETRTDKPLYKYRDDIPNSCELGLELNDPSYYFLIKPKIDAGVTIKPTAATQPLRQLRVIYPRTIPTPTQAEDDFKKILDDRPPPPVTNPVSKNPPPPPNGPVSSKPSTGGAKVEPLPTERTFDYFNTKLRKSGPITSPSSLFTAVSIYADYKPPPNRLTRKVTTYPKADYIPDRNLYFYDLVFQIRKTIQSSGTTSVLAQNLLRIDIDIPIRTATTVKRISEPLLEADYYGPGVRMLSNQRFVPFMFFDPPKGNDPNGKLHIELRPRATDKDFVLTTGDDRTADLSFRLTEAPVSRVEVPSITSFDPPAPKGTRGPWADNSAAQVRIDITEWYKTDVYPGGEPVRQKDPYVVIKRQVADDETWPEFG